MQAVQKITGSNRKNDLSTNANKHKKNKVSNVKLDMNKGAIQVLEENYVPDEINTTIQEDMRKFYEDEIKETLMADNDNISTKEMKENEEYIKNHSIKFINIEWEEALNIVDQSPYSNPETAYEIYESLSPQDKDHLEEQAILEERERTEKIKKEKERAVKQRIQEEEELRVKDLNKKIGNILKKTFTHPKYKEQNIWIIKKVFGLDGEDILSVKECAKELKIEIWRVGVVEKKFIKALEKAWVEVPNEKERKEAKISEIIDQIFTHPKYKRENMAVVKKVFGLDGEKVHSINECVRTLNMERWAIKAAARKFSNALEKAWIEVPNKVPTKVK